jgi:hypothetical protein
MTSVTVGNPCLGPLIRGQNLTQSIGVTWKNQRSESSIPQPCKIAPLVITSPWQSFSSNNSSFFFLQQTSSEKRLSGAGYETCAGPLEVVE